MKSQKKSCNTPLLAAGPFIYIDKIFFSRDEANKNLPLLQIRQDVRFSSKIAFSKYNYESNLLSKVDITGGKMTIYEKQNNTIIDYSLSTKDKVFMDFVELTDQEERELWMLADDIDVDNFIAQIANKYRHWFSLIIGLKPL